MDMDLSKVLIDLLSDFAGSFKNFLLALLVYFIGWIVARTVSRIIAKVLKRIGIDKLAERLNDIDMVANANFKIVPSAVLSKIVYYMLLLIFLIAATDVLGMQAVSDLVRDILNYIPSLISALIVLVLGLVIADFLKNIVKTASASLNIPASGMIANAVFYFVFLNVVMIALTQAGIGTAFIQNNLSIILAGIVIAFALGYGLASREIVANFLASFYSKDKVNIGDYVQIEGYEGEVVNVDNTSMTLQTKENKIIIPLSKLSSSTVVIKNQ